MQIDIRSENRVGIAQEILCAVVGMKLDLLAVEVSLALEAHAPSNASHNN